MKVNVEIFYFIECGLESFDYPTEVRTMTDAEFDHIIEENQCYYDEEMDMHYTPNNDVGYQILEIL